KDALSKSRDAGPAVRAEALETLGWVSIGRGDLAQAREQLEAALALYRELGDLRGATRCRLHLATAAFGAGALEDSGSFLDEAAKAVETFADPQFEAWLAFERGLLALERRQLPLARDYFLDALRLYERTDFQRGTPVCLCNLGEVALAAGDATEAEPLA